MDINKPITNPNLIKAIQLMRLDRTKELQFYNELFKAIFLCPGQIDKSNSTQSGDGK